MKKKGNKLEKKLEIRNGVIRIRNLAEAAEAFRYLMRENDGFTWTGGEFLYENYAVKVSGTVKYDYS